MKVAHHKTMSVDEWRKEGVRRFGSDEMKWRFVCPSCGHVASVQDWKDAGAEESEVAFSCVGRHLKDAKQMCEKPGPCNYAGGGLFRINPVKVICEGGVALNVFDFATSDSSVPEPHAGER